MSDVKFKMTGQRELVDKLKTLDRKMRRSITGKALRAGAKITVRALRSAVPKDTGRGAKAIGTKVKTYRASLVGVAITGERVTKVARGKEKETKAKFGGPHFHLIEYGTGERFKTGLKSARKTGNAELVIRAKRIANVQASINRLGSLGAPLGRFAAKVIGKSRTGRVMAKPFFQKAWRSSIGAMQAAQVAVLKREIEALARTG